jgi:hypothetical protein
VSDGGHVWWEDAIVYQVYPRSFADADGDGVGDLPGLRSRLGYLADLGVDAIWLTPFYPSPLADGGYDVSDYCASTPAATAAGCLSPGPVPVPDSVSAERARVPARPDRGCPSPGTGAGTAWNLSSRTSTPP